MKTSSQQSLQSLPSDVLQISQWIFFGEGGSMIVLSFVGNNPSFQGKVMYLYKITHLHEQYKHIPQKFDEFETAFAQYLPIPEKV